MLSSKLLKNGLSWILNDSDQEKRMTRRKEVRGGRSDEEEGVTRRNEEQGGTRKKEGREGGRDGDEGEIRKVKK